MTRINTSESPIDSILGQCLINEIEVSKCKDYFHFTKGSGTVKIGRFENRINVLTLLNKNFKTNIQ